MKKEDFPNSSFQLKFWDSKPCLKSGTKTFFCCFILFCLFSSFQSQAQILWSNNSSWASIGKTKPVAGSAVTIPAGVHMIMDETPPNLANLTILGKLEFADKNLNLTVGWIMVHGTLQIGAAAMPYTKKAIITLNAPDINESIMGMGTRGIMVMAGKLELHGVPPVPITKLNDHAAAGATSLSLKDPVSWTVDDEIIVAPSDFYGASSAAPWVTKIAAVNSTTSLNIQDGLNAQRWGKLQYLTATGMSLTPGTLPANISPTTPTVLDERAEVANLTRNIVIQSPDDALWQNNGFGCHIMIMRMNGMVGEARLNGIEIKRGGQAGKLGRYPFHWHMLSYEGSTTLPDVTGQYIRNSSVNQSANRGIVIHGTNGAQVSKNVVYDVRGHGIFFEDASERRNIIDGNMVLKVRHPLPGNALKVHETEMAGGSSGYWISNPDNTITNNTAADCENVGFWLAYPKKAFGASASVPIRPDLLKFGVFNGNHTHSNKNEGIFLDNAEGDDAGNIEGGRYTSTTNMQDPVWPYLEVLPYELADYTVWKNNRTGIWNRSNSPRNRRVVSADNTSKFFSGASDNVMTGVIENTLVVGRSLNFNMNGVIVPTNYGADEPPVAFASYHSTFDIKNNVIVNFAAVEGKTSGAFAVDDYYLIPVDKGTIRNPNNIVINSHPGVRVFPSLNQHVYGVVWDPYNYWGGSPSQDNYYSFDNPFFTHGLTKHIVPPSSAVSGGVILPGPFYGFYGYRINNIERTYEKINAIRTTAAGATVGNWSVEAGALGDILGNMRHFATHPTGYYYLDFPTIDNINEFSMTVSNMLTGNDYQVLSVEYSGAYNITKLFASTAYNMNDFGGSIPFPNGESNTHAYTEVTGFQAVLNAPNGEVYWHDKSNNKVWFKVRGGLNTGDPNSPANNDYNLYKEFKVRAYGTLAVNDTQAPTVPLALTASGITQNSANLEWNASTDNVAVTAYEVFKNGVLIGTSTTNSLAVSALTCSSTYTFTVKAKDGMGNTSAASVGLILNTASCNPCATLLPLASPIDDYSSGTVLKQANASTGKITATNKITNTANVTYQAGKSIVLEPGFKANAGTVFKVQLGGCN